MTRHISDQQRASSTARLRAFTQHERQSGMHPAIQALRSRPQTRAEDGRKTAEYLRIARGRMV
ncbi:MAG: hypothetical protein Q4G22_05465 [Paracoccus sp. (in: a-proteobacteria)]|uniref:hypothetical protein n=1 Tax=Paracoccus sp. TaxID=267 RepID=UPI0026E09497|nr:hypothetical protein [Paracoccus sp. (in: a-proteobacteria)]MDO5631271.1 hypothetical protein [Paracoccus sp. (in: a-proteobacteria)]